MSVVGALITLADQVLYPFYAAAPRVFGLPPLADQQIGGLMMWVPGGLVFWLAMTVVWFRWAASENAELETRNAEPAGGVSPACSAFRLPRSAFLFALFRLPQR